MDALEREGVEDREEGRLGVVLVIEGTKGTWLMSSRRWYRQRNDEA